MYYITGASKDLTLYEITSCLTREINVITEKQLNERDDILIVGNNKNKYFSCTEVPDEGELDLLAKDYTNGIKHVENSRYFLFIPVLEVKTIQKPQFVITRRKGDGTGPWKLYMLKNTDKGVTRNIDLAWTTDNKGDAMRKANSINDYYKKNRWPYPDYTVMTVEEALRKIEEDDNMY